MNHMPWTRLSIMSLISFISMYSLMYAMVDSPGNVYPNLNQLYMAGMMTAVMVLIEIAVMSSMYEKKIKIAAAGLGIAAFLAFFLMIRMQAGVSDKDFLKSMIPHHASALLMCEKADLKDPEIRELCGSITSSQQSQIDWMKEKLSAIRQI